MDIIEITRRTDIAYMIPVDQLYGAIYKGERNAHKFVISVYRNGEAVALAGSVTGKMLRADNVAVALVGAIEDGKATVTLSDECYAVPGRFKLSVFVTAEGETETVCVYAAIGTTDRTDAGTIIDGGEIIESVSDLIAEIEAAVATIPPDYSTLTNGVVRHDIAQSLTDAQKTQARANIGAVIDSTLTTAGAVADAKATGDEISSLKSAMDNLKSVEPGWYQGTFSTSTGVVENSTTRCVTNKLYMHNGAIAEIKCNGQQRIAGFFNAITGAFSAINANWLGTDLTYTATADGYLIVQVRKSTSNPTIIPSEVAVTILINDGVQKAATDAIYAKNLSDDIAKGTNGVKTTLTNDILISAVVNESGKWGLPSSVMRSGMIDVSAHKYKTMIIIASSTYNSVYSLLTSSSHTIGDDVDFADSGRHVLEKGKFDIIDISSTTINYICILKYSVVSSSRVDVEPSSIVFIEENSVNVVKNLLKMMKDTADQTIENTEDIAELNAEVDALKNYRRDVPQNQGVRNAYKKAMQFKSVPWELLSAIPNNSSETGISAGNKTGLPYSSVKEYDKFIGYNVSMKTFMTAAHNPYSLLYTEDVKGSRTSSDYGITYNGVNCGAYFGIVCNIFVMHSIGSKIPWNTAEWAYLCQQNILEKPYDQSASGVELMDIIFEPGHGNLIIDIYRDDRGNPVKIFWAESVQNFPQVHEYTPAQFNARMSERNGIIYRYNDLNKNLDYTPSEFVAVDGEPEPTAYVYNDDICTYAGDYACFNSDDDVYINYTAGSYTKIEVYKNDEYLNEASISSDSHAVKITTDGYGKYKARLTDGTNNSGWTYFEIVDTTVSCEYSNGTLTVDFSSENGTPIYAQMTYRTGESRGIIPLTSENISEGTISFSPSEVLEAQYPGGTFARPVYIKVFFEGEYGTVPNAYLDTGIVT